MKVKFELLQLGIDGEHDKYIPDNHKACEPHNNNFFLKCL